MLQQQLKAKDKLNRACLKGTRANNPLSGKMDCKDQEIKGKMEE